MGMPQNYKTSINNLIIVWQGSSWSVIAPDGHVLFRHWSKGTAYDWAKQCNDYSDDSYDPFDGPLSEIVFLENDGELGTKPIMKRESSASLMVKKKNVDQLAASRFTILKSSVFGMITAIPLNIRFRSTQYFLALPIACVATLVFLLVSFASFAFLFVPLFRSDITYTFVRDAIVKVTLLINTPALIVGSISFWYLNLGLDEIIYHRIKRKLFFEMIIAIPIAYVSCVFILLIFAIGLPHTIYLFFAVGFISARDFAGPNILLLFLLVGFAYISFEYIASDE